MTRKFCFLKFQNKFFQCIAPLEITHATARCGSKNGCHAFAAPRSFGGTGGCTPGAGDEAKAGAKRAPGPGPSAWAAAWWKLVAKPTCPGARPAGGPWAEPLARPPGGRGIHFGQNLVPSWGQFSAKMRFFCKKCSQNLADFGPDAVPVFGTTTSENAVEK